MTGGDASSIFLSGDPLFADLVEELSTLLAAGSGSAIETTLQRHPEHAERLRSILPMLEILSALNSSAGRTGSLPGSGSDILGDYRLLREIGRGGMGIVYEAEQLSSKRRVALKMLPLSGMFDERALSRFRREAQAAAGLDHPHIVPIYEVNCDRSVHFYAMRYIDGQSLDRLIRQQQQRDANAAASHDPDWYRQIAELGAQAAAALHYAHDVGVIHRDIKPANLMLEPEQQLWITDFGLAHVDGGPSLTMTGDLVGTLRYMSPEQANGPQAGVDHRTDIYSLGATLYELLTLRPVFQAEGRDEILRRLTNEQPQPLRAFDRHLPRNLETIVLKCLEKDADDRYATAGELAADLQRFAAGLAIRARRPGLVQQCRKWAQQRSAQLLVASAGLALAVLVVAITTGLLWQERGKTLAALEHAKTNAALAEKRRQVADQQFRTALDGFGYLLAPLQQPGNLSDPKLIEIRREQADRAIEYCRKLMAQSEHDPDVTLTVGITYVHIGNIFKSQQEYARAEQSYREAIALFARLVELQPDNARYHLELAQACNILGLDLHDNGRGKDAREAFSRALPEYESTIRLQPDSGAALHLKAWFHLICPDSTFRDPGEALSLCLQAVNQSPQNGSYWNNLGIAQFRIGNYAEALRSLEKSIEIQQGGDSQDWFFLAATHWKLGHHREADKWYSQALTWRMEKNRTSDVELRLFRAEVDAVMGSRDQRAEPNP